MAFDGIRRSGSVRCRGHSPVLQSPVLQDRLPFSITVPLFLPSPGLSRSFVTSLAWFAYEFITRMMLQKCSLNQFISLARWPFLEVLHRVSDHTVTRTPLNRAAAMIQTSLAVHGSTVQWGAESAESREKQLFCLVKNARRRHARTRIPPPPPAKHTHTSFIMEENLSSFSTGTCPRLFLW